MKKINFRFSKSINLVSLIKATTLGFILFLGFSFSYAETIQGTGNNLVRYKTKGEVKNIIQEKVTFEKKHEDYRNSKSLKKKSLKKKKKEIVDNQNCSQPTRKISSESLIEETYIGEPQGTFSEKVDIWIGSNPDFVKKYLSYLHPDDNRLNKYELNFGSGLMENKSNSNFNVRDYNSNSLLVLLSADIWMTPFLGIRSEMLNSSSGEISNIQGSDKFSVTHNWFKLEGILRQYYGPKRKSNVMEFGLQYSDYQLQMPSNSSSRLKLQTTGLGLRIGGRNPIQPTYSQTFGVSVFPWLSHTETRNDSNMNSGHDPETSKFGIEYGGEIKFSHEAQLTWKLEKVLEKNIFQGQSSDALNPAKTSVVNQWTLLTFGYRWGH